MKPIQQKLLLFLTVFLLTKIFCFCYILFLSCVSKFVNELFLLFLFQQKLRSVQQVPVKEDFSVKREFLEAKDLVPPAPLSGGLGEGSGTSTPVLTGNEKTLQGSKKVPHK